MSEAEEIIKRLELLPHPEGGWYREVYRSDELIMIASLPERYIVPHCFSTSIYFLLKSDDFSAFHRIRSDETWHFYLGSPLIIYCIYPDGSSSQVLMGNKLSDGQFLQHTISRDCWFAAKCIIDKSFSLVGCTVSPGFEFQDFKLGQRQKLIGLFPQHTSVITEFTRQ